MLSAASRARSHSVGCHTCLQGIVGFDDKDAPADQTLVSQPPLKQANPPLHLSSPTRVRAMSYPGQVGAVPEELGITSKELLAGALNPLVMDFASALAACKCVVVFGDDNDSKIHQVRLTVSFQRK